MNAGARVLRWWMTGLTVLLVAQFTLAGFGVGYGGAVRDGFDAHFHVGNWLLYLYGAAVVLAVAGRAGARAVALTGLGTGLVLLQHALALVNVPGTLWGQSLFAVHALNGLALIFLAHRTGVGVRNRIREAAVSDRSPSPAA